MTKILVVVCAVVIGLGAVHASAQVPNVSVYFDEDLQFTQANCPAMGIGIPDTVYVVANNFGIWMSGIEYMIEYPMQLSFVVDIINEDYLYAGTSPTGIGITFPVPAPAFDSFLVQRVLVQWNCESCDGAPAAGWPLSVVGYPYSGLVRAVEFGSNQVIIGVGMTSAICATNPVVDETWGGIKALYQ
jgi:hypothetical protein